MTLLLLLIFGCGQPPQQPLPGCDVVVEPSVPSAQPGSTVEITGGPFSAVYDTTLHVAGVEADVTTIDSSDCDACRACRDDVDCEYCGSCEPCDDVCDCTETLLFVVPPVAPGPTRLQLINRWGTSEQAEFTVAEP